ncbi:YqaA family protein [Humitalea sp. 24SJ18S-53]|uniref:YqaA family protein n=1 Tax=Humitalea sp. 24SJ18S-53 TaxID=3422307 RepID=UPI003D668E03
MIRKLYDRIIALAAHERAGWWLFGVSFAESSFFPIPPDAMLIPMCLARPERAWRYAALCTIASVLGGILGYAIGYWLFDAVAMPVLAAYGHPDAMVKFQGWFDAWGLWVILIKGFTPIPYKLVTIASGAAHFSFVVFIMASVATRGARFFLLAGLLRAYGPPIREFIETRLTAVTTVAVVAVVAGLLVVRLL